MIVIVMTEFWKIQYASDSWLTKCNFKELFFFSFLFGKVGDIRDESNLLCSAELGKLFSEINFSYFRKQLTKLFKNNLLQPLRSKKDTSNWKKENYNAINPCLFVFFFFRFLNRSRKPLSNCI